MEDVVEQSSILTTLGDNIGWIILALAALIIIVTGLFTVDEKSEKVIKRFGKYLRTARPGIRLKIPLVDTVDGIVSFKVQQLDIEVVTTTKDSTTVKAEVSLLYEAIDGRAYDAHFKAEEMQELATAYVTDALRGHIPTLDLDEAMKSKEEIGDAVRTRLAGVLEDYGYRVKAVLVPAIDPPEEVLKAMNEINAAKRQRTAATELAEAEKTMLIAKATADKETKKLQGEGIAAQRKAIIDGFKSSIEELKEATGLDEEHVLRMLLTTQYFDTLEVVGKNARNNTIMLPHGPGAVNEILQQLTGFQIAGAKAGNGIGGGPRTQRAPQAGTETKNS